jgi:hypothetical protein
MARKKRRTGRSNVLVNLALALCGLGAAVLLYAFVVRNVAPRITPTRDENPTGLVGEIIQVEVRNGCGVSGLAAEMTLFLREQGFDVVEVGDYKSFDLERSIVFDRTGDLEAAKKVAAVLTLPEAQIVQEIRPDLYLDASVVIGKDYKSLKPFRKE